MILKSKSVFHVCLSLVGVGLGKAFGIDNIKEDRNDGRDSFLAILILDSDCLPCTNMILGGGSKSYLSKRKMKEPYFEEQNVF